MSVYLGNDVLSVCEDFYVYYGCVGCLSRSVAFCVSGVG